jgi:signal recognition particle GTPase
MQDEKFNMLNEDQKFVNQILDKRGLQIEWLAEKLNMDYKIVRYQLRDAVNYRQDFHEKVKEIFRKEGLVSSNAECTEKIKDELIDFNTVLSGTMSIVSKGIKERLPNGIDDKEKQELKGIIRNQMNRVLDEFNDLLLTIEMK